MIWLFILLSLHDRTIQLTGEEGNANESHNDREEAEERRTEDKEKKEDKHMEQEDGDGRQYLHRTQPICM